MTPVKFSGYTGVLQAPESMPDVMPLPFFRGEDTEGVPVVISCWELTESELQEVIKTKRVWLSVVGRSAPPVRVSAETPFVPLPCMGPQ